MGLLNDARAIAKKHDLDGVLIIGVSLSEETMPSASYGRNRRLCKHFGDVLDNLLWEFEQGYIEIIPKGKSNGEEA